MTLCNFEGTLTDRLDSLTKKVKSFNFSGPTAYTRILREGGVDAANLANNHSFDYKEEGLADTQAALSAAGIPWCYTGVTAVYETKGVKIGLIGNTFPYANSKCDISADVKALREAGCEIVIASFHWGVEYETAFSAEQKKLGRAAIDAGADVVVGTHPHITQGIECYNGHYILYSLGNAVFGGNNDPSTAARTAYFAQLTFVRPSETEAFAAPTLKIIPIRTRALASGNDFRPVLAEGSEAEKIVSSILKRSKGMEGFINAE